MSESMDKSVEKKEPPTLVERLNAAADWNEPGISKLFREAAEEIDQHNRSFDLYRDASRRATKRWQAAHPGNDLVWPDTADLIVWLMEQNDFMMRKIEAYVTPSAP